MIIHVVEPGDNLYALHERYRVSMADLLRVNDLPDPEQLVVGLALLIPVKGTWHTVRAGESLWSIANDYGMSLNLVLEANPGIDAEILMPGQEIFIPLLRHEVAPGETLASIANQYGVSVYALAQENALTITEPIFTGQILFIPREKPIIDVNAYSYQQDAAGAQSIREVGELLTIVSPFAYLIQADGSLEPFPDEQMIAASYEENILPMMSILNFTSEEAGSTLTHTILTSDELMDTLLTNILRVMNEKGYRGLNIDFENVLPEDRERFNNFIQLAVDRLHPEGYFVSTAVAPKTSADQPGLLYEAHDYAAQGRIADFVVVMTYEWGYRLGPPQAISPLNQMRRVIEYALTEIPSEKIFLGFQIYARDWRLPHVQGQAAQTFSPQRAVELATEYNAEIQYDEVAASPFFRYTDEDGVDHEVWFEDARSAQAKFDLAKEFNLGGISYWALGYPFPQNWELLRDNFTVRKRI
ncbi:LysM peptidoglycan-binding domain-containing protein [Oceanobacillus alkalisoli]|uniref:LysM peptidoglycan-binding domain-containing protein n=1 Tax=Oceanobacillus alkalisoli TaxID=2925113 RepID=UPI001EE46C84|nr:LysM peptidoglycan-binding domain-containing protein [Oceanobacillus alkalisoli]MCG5102853.1 LysM peptidoglycan-binding domain-containing protein [Oceanobacillus alkalisoli]